MNIKVIKTEEEYDLALIRIDELFDTEPNTEEYDEVELLMTLVKLYEQKHYAIDAPDAESLLAI